MFDYYDDFVTYYRMYSPTDAMWHAWKAAQDFNDDDFEGAEDGEEEGACGGEGDSEAGSAPKAAQESQSLEWEAKLLAGQHLAWPAFC
mgnify:CR=1 FL=1